MTEPLPDPAVPVGQSPSQTVGPFFHHALLRPLDGTPGTDGIGTLDPEGVAGTPVVVTGQVLDGAGDPVTDAMVEVWQADGAGRFRHPRDARSGDVPDGFVGFGRVATDGSGTYRITTAMPGTVPGPGGTTQAPHLNVHVFARGLLDRLATRIYLPAGAAAEAALDADPVLAAVPADRRRTLIAQPDGTADGATAFRHDIVLQGAAETVFFDA